MPSFNGTCILYLHVLLACWSTCSTFVRHHYDHTFLSGFGMCNSYMFVITTITLSFLVLYVQ